MYLLTIVYRSGTPIFRFNRLRFCWVSQSAIVPIWVSSFAMWFYVGIMSCYLFSISNCLVDALVYILFVCLYAWWSLFVLMALHIPICHIFLSCYLFWCLCFPHTVIHASILFMALGCAQIKLNRIAYLSDLFVFKMLLVFDFI
jgi:hypothetical protein